MARVRGRTRARGRAMVRAKSRARARVKANTRARILKSSPGMHARGCGTTGHHSGVEAKVLLTANGLIIIDG